MERTDTANRGRYMQKLLSHEIRQLPKIDLHRHLDCSVRWSTLVELAPQVGIELPPLESQKKDLFLITEPMRDLGAVLNKFLNAQKVLASEEILTRITYEACEDAYNDNVQLVEFRYAPTFIQDGHNLSFERIHASISRGVQMAQKKWPLQVGLICIIQRIKSFETAQRVVDFALSQPELFCGLDLADNEDGFDPKTFAPLFGKAKKAGLRITVHSGETPNSLSPLWVRDSIEILGAERIGHGVQIIHNPEILNFVIQKKIPLEICPYSNYLTQAFPRHEDHPVRKLRDAGVLITINSDDPGVFYSQLSDDYLILNTHHGFGVEDFKKCNQVALGASFLADDKKRAVAPLFL